MREIRFKNRPESNWMSGVNSVVSSSFLGDAGGYLIGEFMNVEYSPYSIVKWSLATAIMGFGCGVVAGAIIAVKHPYNALYYYVGSVGYSITLPLFMVAIR